ncbi:MAG: TIGR02285 family protein [Rhodospirillales bacterium]|jgi:uncharacterized protein (TIGR02285 family)|nr:TIGR02285 family protein [Rhodospirillales bacterium]
MMPGMRRLCVLGFALAVISLCLSTRSSIAQDDSILWLYPDFPPVYIIKGENARKGVGDKVLAFFQERMPEYRHEERIANFKRIIVTLAAGEKACSITLLKNKDREKVVLFSEPFMLSPQNEIITTKDQLPIIKTLIDSDGAVSLKEMMETSGLVLGYSTGRSYSSSIDQIINSSVNGKNSFLTFGNDIFEGLMRMMKRGRVDYTIGYGYEGRYIAKNLEFEKNVIAIPMRENPSYVPVYAGCPRNVWGQNIIRKLNEIINTARYSSVIYGTYQEWLDPESWERYQKNLPKMLWDIQPN